MMRGILGGLLVSAIGLVVASQFLPRVDLSLPAPEAGGVDVPAGSEFNAELPDTQPILPATEGRPSPSNAPLETAEGTAAAPAVDTAPAGAPATPEVASALDTPAEPGATGPAVTAGAEDSVETLPGAAQPSQPGVEQAPVAETELAVPQTGEVAEAPQAPAAGEGPGAAPAMETESDAPVATAEQGTAMSAPAADAAPVADGPAAEPVTVPEMELALPALDVDAPTPPSAGLTAGTDLPSLGALNTGVQEDSLPKIGAEAPAPSEDASAPALERFAVPFDAADNKPRLGIVLIDTVEAVALDLSKLDVPVSVAVDPLAPGAAARTLALRAQGVEVLMLTPIPEGASPADVEVAFQEFLRAVPQAVAAMDVPGAAMQESRPRAVQVVDILKETGHGLVTYDKGLNSALQVSAQQDLPAATVARVVDDGKGDTADIKRLLDKGAFDGARDGAAIVVGVLRKETLVALTEWLESNRAGSVTLAPVSAVLTKK